MTVYSAFAPSTLGMLSQSYALNVIGNNVANVNTSGFKGTDTRFSTVLSHSLFQQSDLGGAVPNDLHRINIQGSVIGTDSEQNLAINGQGFFILERTFGSGNYYYGRAGDFQMRTVNDITVENNGETITTKDGYLVDKNGYFVMGYVPDVDGTFPTSGGTLQALRVDAFAFTDNFLPTANVNMDLNVPADDDAGTQYDYTYQVYDSNGDLQAVKTIFTKSETLNTWTMTETTTQDAVAQVDTVSIGGTVEAGDVYSVTVNGNIATYTVTGTEADISVVRDNLITAIQNASGVGSIASPTAGAGSGDIILTANSAGTAFTSGVTATNNGATADNTGTSTTTTANVENSLTSSPVTMTFDENGALVSPTSRDISLTFEGGSTATYTLDLSAMSQFAGGFMTYHFDKDGYGNAELKSYYFDADGQVIGRFDDGTNRAIYKIPLALFSNPNALDPKNGNVYAESEASGEARIATADSQGFFTFLPSSLEYSNVDIADQFTKMIMVQHAYNSSAQVVRTVDEMVETARDMKR